MSLEIFQTLSKLTSNSLQTQIISCLRVFFLYCFFFDVCLEETNDLGVSLEIIQTLSKLICFHFFWCYVLFYLYIFVWTRGMSLEWVWRFFKLSPNSLQTHMCFFNFIFSLEMRNEFGVTLEILQTLSKLTPNSLQTQRISFFSILLLFFGKEK